jgi:signal transduction histidine kinase
LVKAYDAEVVEILGYSGQISQVFINLIANALDAIDLSEAPIQKPQIIITTELLDDDWIAVTINDNGPGIPEAVRPHIFENFYTTKPEEVGTGLGLAIVHEIVTKNHGGRIMFRSDSSWGTEFEVRLPISSIEI